MDANTKSHNDIKCHIVKSAFTTIGRIQLNSETTRLRTERATTMTMCFLPQQVNVIPVNKWHEG